MLKDVNTLTFIDRHGPEMMEEDLPDNKVLLYIAKATVVVLATYRFFFLQYQIV